MSIDRLYELFKTNKNTLVSPKKWDDPFENFILNSTFKLDTGEIVDLGFRNDFFGQCWSRHNASDAMWRIYSPDSNSVRIRTTIPKLADSLAKSSGKLKDIRCFIGKVRYLNNNQLIEFGDTIFKGKLPQPYEIAETLLVKRPAFKHENEVRLLYFKGEDETYQDIYQYDIDPHSLIDQIMVDPRVEYSKYKEIRAEIKSRTKFNGKILRSLLYTPPKKMLFSFG